MSVGLVSMRGLVIFLICASIGCRQESPSVSGSSLRFAEFTLFNTKADATDVVPSGSIRIDMSQPLEKRLQILADAIYGPGWFRVVEIEDSDQGKKATIEMIDPEPAPSHLPGYTPWYAKFQGSSGSDITSRTINKTFAQIVGRQGWIEEVVFTYHGDLGQHTDRFFRIINSENAKDAAGA